MRSIILLVLCCLGMGVADCQTGTPKMTGTDGQPGFDPPGANDHIFSPAAAAKPFIDFDAKGFLVGGKRVFLVSAGMEYARVPHELWQDRLLRLKRAGFNCIEIYTFWNIHEPREGQFDFNGDHDLEAFLRLVKHMGLYAIVRVGPYYCAEWDNGGYPLWLRFKPGVRVREDNAEFEKYVDRFFDKLFPIVNRQQIHHGGPVVLVQLENEHPKGWGTIMPDGYFHRLRDKALALGLEIPYFFSGLHHSSDPAGDLPRRPGEAGAAGGGAGGRDMASNRDPASLDDPSRPNPWLSTEFWSVWYSGYGSTDKDAREYERRTWKIIAHGGNGYNYYMAHGGSNFAYTNNDEDAASYDYGAAVGQAGDLRPIYYSFKRMGWFARSFENILENSGDGTAAWKAAGAATDRTDTAEPALTVTARHSPAGDLIFLDNPSASAVSTFLTAVQGVKLPVGGSLSLAPGEIFPIVHHFVMDSAVTLEWAPVRVLGISGQGNTTTIVIYGEAGSPAELYFSVRGKADIPEDASGLSVKAGAGISAQGESRQPAAGWQQVVLQTKFSNARTPVEYTFRAGGKRWRILVMSRPLADRTWLVESAGRNYIVCGPAYVGELRVKAGELPAQPGRMDLVVESPWEGGAEYPVWLYGDRSAPVLLATHREMHAGRTVSRGAGLAGDAGSAGKKMKLSLAPWQFQAAAYPAGPGYYDNDWKYSGQPLQMGADGDGTADAWYRTKLHVDTAGLYTLQVEGSDRATVFVDGAAAGTGAIRDGEITFNFSKGPHTLAFFTAHDGRDKLAAYLGSMDSVDRKGLFGNAILRKGGPSIVPLGGWRFLKASAGAAFPAAGTTGWQDYTIGQDAFAGKEGFGWFRTVLANPAAGVSEIVLNFKSVDENATVFINGRKIGRHEGWNQPFEVIVGGLDTLQRPLELTLFMENYSNEGGVDKPVRANYTEPGKEITGWFMRGGPGSPLAGAWKILPAGKAGPCFYRSTFVAPAYGVTGAHPIWRVHTEGLGHGSVWVNGHNLGRYPEKIKAPGLYLPECWLKTGRNSLVIFEEDGKEPGQVAVQAERAASRDQVVFSNF